MRDYPKHHVIFTGNTTEAHIKRYGILRVSPTHITKEKHIPRILVEAGVVASASEVRRNRPELVEDLPDVPHFQRITYGKRIVDIFVH